MRSKSVGFCLILIALCSPRLSAQLLTGQKPSESRLDHIPLIFEPNRGQADSEVSFLSRGNAYGVTLTPDRTVFMLRSAAANGKPGRPELLTLKLVSSNKKATSQALDLLPGKSNYFIGRESQKWISGIPQYGRVGFKSIYPGIDVLYYGNDGELEYDFVVSPGADPKAIGFSIEGVKKVTLNEEGNLHLLVSSGMINLHKPIIYQETDGARQAITGNFVLLGENQIGIEVGNYDRRKPMIIDPVLSYSTLIGANNETQVQGIAVDHSGSIYVTGTTFASNYPTVNAFQPTNNGSSNVFVTKLNPSGEAILYSTYLGGSAFDNSAAIAVDESGNAYVTGTTGSSDFPTTPGAFMTTCGSFCNTPFVAKILSDGSLGFSTLMGGSNTPAHAIAVDSSGEAYIAGGTASNDLPTTPGSFEPVYPGLTCTSCENAYVEKLNESGTALVYSTYFGAVGFGGVPSTEGTGIAVDDAGSAYLVGNTTAIPVKNPLQSSYVGQNSPNAFIAKFSADGSSLVYSTYLGGSSDDFATGVAVDSLGNAHIVGTSTSCDFPLTLNALNTQCATIESTQEVFVTTLNSSGTQILFSTFLDIGVSSGIAVDSAGNTYVTGTANSASFPVLNPIESTSQEMSPPTFVNGFVTELDLSGKLLFSTYLGETGGGSASAGIAVDRSGGIYVAGTGQGDFPLLHPLPKEVLQNTGNTIFLAKISPQDKPQFSLSPRVGPVLALRNVSSMPLSINSITPSSNFTKGGTCSSSLAPGTGCTLILEGAPDHKITGTVTIDSNAYEAPQTFVISKSRDGDTVGSIVSIFPMFLQFPLQLIGTTSEPQDIVIQNSGLLPAAINSIRMIQPSTFTQANDCPAMLNANSSCTVKLKYTAATQQDFAQVAIIADPDQTRYTLFLGGSGSASALAPSITFVEFGSQLAGARPLGRIVNIINTTPYPAVVTNVSVSAGFAQTNTCNTTLAPFTSCRVSVTFVPTGNEDRSGTLTAGGLGPGGAQTVSLHGTGIAPGDLGVSPVTLDFVGAVGSVSGPQIITLANNSPNTVTITKIQANPPFLQTNNCPSSLALAGSCQISVSFKPTNAGLASGKVQASFLGNGSPQSVALTGNAQASSPVQFSPTSLQFGNQPVGEASSEMGIDIVNNGGTTVNLGNVTVQGSDYSIEYNSCSGATLNPFYACSIGVVFTPSAMGLRTGSLSVVANGSSSPLTASLQGDGVSSGVGSLSPGSLDFGTHHVGTMSQAMNVTLTNSGAGQLTVNGITASSQFLTPLNNCGAPLAKGAECTITVLFAPTLPGILQGTLTVQDDGLGSPHTVVLTGIGK